MAAASLTMLFACEKPVDLGPEEVTIVSSDVLEEIPVDGGEYTIELKATLDWSVQNYEGDVTSWLNITPSRGSASADNQTVSIKVLPNDGANRSFDIVFYGNIMHSASLTINQTGPKGDGTEGTGTVDNPFNVAAAIKYIDENEYYGDADNPNVSPEVYVKGTIASIEEVDPSFGNATYVISDGEGTAELEVYRGKYLNGDKFTSEDQIKVGDEVVVAGQLTRFFETYEFTTGSRIHSLNGEEGEEPVVVDPVGSGTAEDPFNVAAAYKFIDDGQYYGDADNPNVSPEKYVKGVITSIEEVDTGQYGNATYVISDGEGTAELEVFRGYYLNGEKFTSKDQIEVGDEVVVVGQLTRFFETYEFTTGSKIYSLNGQTSGGEDPDPKPDPGEVGTEENPYDVISALAAIDDNGWSNNNGSPDLYVKGIISSIDEIDTGQYGNATYYISDDGSRANELMVFRGYYIDGEKFTSSDQIKVGDEVVVVGSLMKYYNDYEFTSGSRIVSHKDNGGVEPVGPDIPEDALVFDLGSNYQTWSEATDATYGGGFETTVDGITLGYYKYGNNNDARAADPDHIRVYKGSAFRVKSDKNITNIILFCTGSGYCENLSPLVGGGSYSVDSSTLTIEWAGSASEIVAESAEAQVRFNKIAIVCE